MGAEQLTEQQKRVLELRKEFLTKMNNPYRHMTNEGGFLVMLTDYLIDF